MYALRRFFAIRKSRSDLELPPLISVTATDTSFFPVLNITKRNDHSALLFLFLEKLSDRFYTHYWVGPGLKKYTWSVHRDTSRSTSLIFAALASRCSSRMMAKRFGSDVESLLLFTAEAF
jgi:hypothetical protein